MFLLLEVVCASATCHHPEPDQSRCIGICFFKVLCQPDCHRKFERQASCYTACAGCTANTGCLSEKKDWKINEQLLENNWLVLILTTKWLAATHLTLLEWQPQDDHFYHCWLWMQSCNPDNISLICNFKAVSVVFIIFVQRSSLVVTFYYSHYDGILLSSSTGNLWLIKYLVNAIVVVHVSLPIQWGSAGEH